MASDEMDRTERIRQAPLRPDAYRAIGAMAWLFFITSPSILRPCSGRASFGRLGTGRTGWVQGEFFRSDRPRAPISGVSASGSLPGRRPEPDVRLLTHPALHCQCTVLARAYCALVITSIIL